MLIYHPMFDPYHCALRISCIVIDSELGEIEWDRLRLLDFFVTFPHLLRTIRLPQELRLSRVTLKAVPDPYESLPSPSRLFFQLNEIQASAASMLAARGFLDRGALLRASVVLAKTDETSKLEEVAAEVGFRTSEWYQFVVNHLSRLPLHGRDGLKERSGLMEFRHDPV